MNIEAEIEKIKTQIEQLKKDSHPPKGLHDLDGTKELLQRLEKLENFLSSKL
tara:strand:- start:412 stop:567 length:156 start_codon:yes stop_codon:yes gene_type:complete